MYFTYGKYLFAIVIPLLPFFSCTGQSSGKDNATTFSTKPSEAGKAPNFAYVTIVPDDWVIYDTMMSGLNIRHLLPTIDTEGETPRGNILIASMKGQDVASFTQDNMDYLRSNMSGITIIDHGIIDSSQLGGEWFTYTKDQDGAVRDMINYIMPYHGFAYMVTLGSKSGTKQKYRSMFDAIARSVNPE